MRVKCHAFIKGFMRKTEDDDEKEIQNTSLEISIYVMDCSTYNNYNKLNLNTEISFSLVM